MELRPFVILSGAVLLIFMKAAPSFGENDIQAFVNSNGKVVFTNLVDNAPAPHPPAGASEAADILVREVPPALRTLVDTIAMNYGVDSALVRAVIKTESNFNRWAVSSKGARGLMQLIPETGRRYGVRDFFDPQQNVEGGVRYLKFLLEKFHGDIDLSLAAYNAGENLVERMGRIPQIAETTDYVRKVRAIYKKKFAPIVAPAVMIAEAAAPEPETSKIFRVVDERGVVHFSNIEPPN